MGWLDFLIGMCLTFLPVRKFLDRVHGDEKTYPVGGQHHPTALGPQLILQEEGS